MPATRCRGHRLLRRYTMFMDACGGHAMPYHIHTDPLCNYEASAAGHSTIVGVLLDG